MPVPDISGLPPFADFNDVTIKINDLVQRLRQLLLTLDTLNIRSLHAKVIEAETITGDKIQANTITAGKMDVEELSAISANLGHIIAGLIESVEIYGSYIATSKDSYPRSEMSNTSNMFAARASSSNAVEMRSNGSNSVADVRFVNGGNLATISHPSASTGLLMDGQTLRMEFSNIYLNGYSRIEVPSWYNVRSGDENQTLDDALNNLAYNMTFDSTTRNLKLWSRGGNLLAQVNIP